MKSGRIPDDLIRSLRGVSGFDEDAFIEVHEKGSQVVSVRINPQKINDIREIFPEAEKIPWSSAGYYLPERPSFILDPLLHAGAYYVQEASGMFLGQCLAQAVDLSSSIKVLDLCAAPGGKSTLIQSLISEESLLVSNEVIKSRAAILVENLTKWGGANTVITNSDPRDIGRLKNFFDVIVVDAPCSGSGLFRRDEEAITEWSTHAVHTCSLRQQRILADVYESLNPNGTLIYSTCSYSPEEDEEISDWLMTEYGLESIRIQTRPEWNIIETNSRLHNAYGYRFFPDKLKGEGFFVACFRKKDGDKDSARATKNKPDSATAAEKAMVAEWIEHDDLLKIYRHKEELFAFPEMFEKDLLQIQAHLYVRKAGITVGKPLKNDLVPDHSLALSGFVNHKLPTISLKKEEALQYLRKEEVSVTGTRKGWTLMQYNGLPLGWVKVLENRVNNYYPKEWRILKIGNS